MAKTTKNNSTTTARKTTVPKMSNTAPTAVAPCESAAATCCGPTEEQIRVRAFEIYQRRKGGPGDPHSDWLQAQAELRAELQGKPRR